MTTIVRSIDVNVPVRTAYNQWIRFDEFPKFMAGVKQVTQMDPKRLHWKAEIAGQENERVAKIIEQTPDKRIVWTSRDGALHGAMVTFHPLSDAQSKILLRVGRTMGGVVNNVGDALDALSLRVEGDLERFKAFIETRSHEIEAWQDKVWSACNMGRRCAGDIQVVLLAGSAAPKWREGLTMAEKPCANPRCTCAAEPGKEFCSNNCREANVGASCSCAHKGCRGKR